MSKRSFSKSIGERIWGKGHSKRSHQHQRNRSFGKMEKREENIALAESERAEIAMTDADPIVDPAVSIASQQDVNDGKGLGDGKAAESDAKKPGAKKMHKWPSDPTSTVAYGALVSPLKKIIEEGYRLVRNKKNSFEYEGFNIGKEERKAFPPPIHRFSEKLLEVEKKRDNSLLDVVLHTVFLLGIEQGRRVERNEALPVKDLITAMEKYRKDNHRLRFKVDELDARIKLKLDLPNDIPEAEFEEYVKLEVSSRKGSRLTLAKMELGEDPLKAFQTKQPAKLGFQSLVKLGKSIAKECTLDRWKEMLEEHGWDMNEWIKKCKHKNTKIEFQC